MKDASQLTWGVVLRDSGLLWSEWAGVCPPRWKGEPSSPLLFRTRREAYDWTRAKHAFCAKYPDGHVCRKWKFRVVWVKQTIVQVYP
jgi:hypothetical protein